MPITKELENIRKFESVGFTHEQAEILTDVIEKSHVDSQQGLKNLFLPLENKMNGIENRINGIENRMNGIDNKINGIENRINGIENKLDNVLNVTDNIDLHIKAGQADLLLKIFAIAAGCTSIAVAVSKLL